MSVPIKVPVKQLAEAFKNLSSAERKELESLLGKEWFQPEEVKRTIGELLEKSEKQHGLGMTNSNEDVLRESKEKYGL